jgi:hypothetical protein
MYPTNLGNVGSFARYASATLPAGHPVSDAHVPPGSVIRSGLCYRARTRAPHVLACDELRRLQAPHTDQKGISGVIRILRRTTPTLTRGSWRLGQPRGDIRTRKQMLTRGQEQRQPRQPCQCCCGRRGAARGAPLQGAPEDRATWRIFLCSKPIFRAHPDRR